MNRTGKTKNAYRILERKPLCNISTFGKRKTEKDKMNHTN